MWVCMLALYGWLSFFMIPVMRILLSQINILTLFMEGLFKIFPEFCMQADTP